MRLLAQESVRSGSRRAHDVFAARVGRLLSEGALRESETVSLSSLGLLWPTDLDGPLRELSRGQRRRLDLEAPTTQRVGPGP